MSKLFWETTDKEQREEYIKLLSIIGSLSNLFSESKNPFLYYRAHENLFCRTFEAENLARGDISFDASKSKMGIGLKTFLHSNGKTFQKVAEFNADNDIIRELKGDQEAIVHKISDLRNKRIDLAKNLTDTTDSIYHLITRDTFEMRVYESPLDYIDLNKIRLDPKQSKNTIRFNDGNHDYSFSLSKNTLLMRFNTDDCPTLDAFKVDILDDPFSFLLNSNQELSLYSQDTNTEESVVLPLYSSRGEKHVPKGSGLNQWNASGRKRHPDEVYIPIPSWIHKEFPTFFEKWYLYNEKNVLALNNTTFQLDLPNGQTLAAKVAQEGGKALMSDPNRDLGYWILREVLKVKEGELISIELLEELNIDSVRVTKINKDRYKLDFCKTGTYDDFKENYN